MREILFRGKRKDNGKWIEGDLRQDKDLGESYVSGWNYYYTDRTGAEREPFEHEVIPETVGQYTGLKDTNGRKIFEGDIVRYGTNIYEVVFETRCGCGYFGIKMSHIETWNFCNITPANLMEIIGNIHDNPELLKGE